LNVLIVLDIEIGKVLFIMLNLHLFTQLIQFVLSSTLFRLINIISTHILFILSIIYTYT